MKTYQSFDEIELELKQLELQRKITFEELKLLKNDLKDDLQPYQWLQTGFKYAGKFGMIYFIKKIFKR